MMVIAKESRYYIRPARDTTTTTCLEQPPAPVVLVGVLQVLQEVLVEADGAAKVGLVQVTWRMDEPRQATTAAAAAVAAAAAAAAAQAVAAA